MILRPFYACTSFQIIFKLNRGHQKVSLDILNVVLTIWEQHETRGQLWVNLSYTNKPRLSIPTPALDQTQN